MRALRQQRTEWDPPFCGSTNIVKVCQRENIADPADLHDRNPHVSVYPRTKCTNGAHQAQDQRNPDQLPVWVHDVDDNVLPNLEEDDRVGLPCRDLTDGRSPDNTQQKTAAHARTIREPIFSVRRAST